MLHLLSRSDRLLSSILLGNTLVNVFAASLASVAVDRLVGGTAGLAISVFGMTFVLLAVGEVTPKVLASSYAERLAPRVSVIISAIVAISSPVSSLLARIASAAVRLSGAGTEHKPLSEAEIISLLELGHSEGVLGSEALVTVSLLTLGERLCTEAMVPRAGVSAVRTGWTRDRLVGTVSSGGFTRYPLLGTSKDRVLGFVDARDILCSPDSRSFPVYWMASFPENANLASVLEELRSGKSPMGAVFDEYGDWSGIVTVEDIVEFAVFHAMGGRKELPSGVHRHGKGFSVPGDLKIDALSRLLGVQLESSHSETVAGLVEESCGRIPAEGEKMEVSGAVITIVRASGPRIERVFAMAAAREGRTVDD